MCGSGLLTMESQSLRAAGLPDAKQPGPCDGVLVALGFSFAAVVERFQHKNHDMVLTGSPLQRGGLCFSVWVSTLNATLLTHQHTHTRLKQCLTFRLHPLRPRLMLMLFF